MPSQILQARIQSLTPEYSDFVFSDFTDEAIRSIQSAGFINFDNQVLENGIFLYLTLFLHKFALMEFIIIECHQSIKDTKQILEIIIGMMPEEMVEQQSLTSVALETTDELVKEKDRFAIVSTNENLLNQYLYLKTSDYVDKLAQKYLGTNNDLVEQFKGVLSDIALGFYKKEDTVPLLQQELELDPKNAAQMGTEVLDLFETVTKATWLPPTTPNQIVASTQVTESTILPELRTMAADMIEGRSPVRNTFNAGATIDEPIYTSTQPTIERVAPAAPSYTAPMYEQPKPNVDAPLEKPRWG